MGWIPGLGTEIPHASQPKNRNIKQQQYCKKHNKDFKNGPYKKKNFLKGCDWKRQERDLQSDGNTWFLDLSAVAINVFTLR